MDSPPGPPTDARAELVRLLQRYVVEAVRLGRAFAERHDMHPTDWAALLAVVHGDRVGRPLTPGDLGERLGISSGATTAVVDRLERAGHVRRVRDDRDRRRLTLHRADSATALLSAFCGPLDAAMDEHRRRRTRSASWPSCSASSATRSARSASTGAAWGSGETAQSGGRVTAISPPRA